MKLPSSDNVKAVMYIGGAALVAYVGWKVYQAIKAAAPSPDTLRKVKDYAQVLTGTGDSANAAADLLGMDLATFSSQGASGYVYDPNLDTRSWWDRLAGVQPPASSFLPPDAKLSEGYASMMRDLTNRSGT